MIQRLCGLFIIACVACGTPVAEAQTYPQKPVRIIVPQAAGGATDLMARAVGQRLSATWGQQVVVENKPGANNLIAAEYVAKSPPDGYTLFASPEATFVTNPYIYRNLPYDSDRDFTPVSGLGAIYQVLVVHPSVPANNVRELIALAKAKPGEIAVGTLAKGAAGHLNVVLFEQMAGVKLNVVHYRGGAPSLKDVIGGHVQITILSVALTGPQIKAGAVKALGIGSPKRIDAFPDLPTIDESGVPGYEAAGWFGLVAPAGTPREIVAKLNADIQRVVTSAEFKEKFLTPNSIEPILGTPQQFAGYIRAGAAKWSKLIRDTNIRVD
ncbi:MAG: tripartite tricarboxylate transporter substrate binding protein [Rhizobiales bacterium]|nr:tripartite tricarboxylate transporter substrate binding protein [Hyphomicrobiales bacterium]